MNWERFTQLKEFQTLYTDRDVSKASVLAANLEICQDNEEIIEILEDYVNQFITSENFSLEFIQDLLLKLKLYRWIEIQTSTNLTQMLVNLILNTVLVPEYLKKWQYERNYRELKSIIDRQLKVFNLKIKNLVSHYTVEIWNVNELSQELKEYLDKWINTIRPRSFSICEAFWFNNFIYNSQEWFFQASIPINLDNKINKSNRKIPKQKFAEYIKEVVEIYEAAFWNSISKYWIWVELVEWIDTENNHNNWSWIPYLTVRITKVIDIEKNTTDMIPNLIEILKVNNFIISNLISKFGFKMEKMVRLFTNWSILDFESINEQIHNQSVNVWAIMHNQIDFENLKMTDKNPVYLRDVWWQKEAKKQIEWILDMIKKETLYKKLWAKVLKWIIFQWPTWTWKTLLARVIATEVDAMIYNIKSTDIQSGSHLNEWAKNMKQLFKFLREKRRKTNKRIIVIFDEMDSLFTKRWWSINASQEDAKVVNAFLSEQNGMDDIENIIFVWTTNRKDVIDEAVLRRFENEVKVWLPEHEWIVETYNIYIGKLPVDGKKLFDELDADKLATKSKWLSQASIEVVVNKLITKKAFEATTLEDIKKITYEDVDQVIKEVKKEEGSNSIWFHNK